MSLSRREILINQYHLRHKAGPYGRSSEKHLAQLQQFIVDGGFRLNSVLDYGCGQSRLVDWIAKLHDATPYRYDPAIAEYETLPSINVDLAINTDVLEHIPEEDLDFTLGEIRSCAEHCYIVVSTRLAKEILPNGENAHCTVKSPEFWNEMVSRYFPKARQVENLKPDTVTFITW